MTKKELLNKIDKQQEIIDALFSHLKLELLYQKEKMFSQIYLTKFKMK